MVVGMIDFFTFFVNELLFFAVHLEEFKPFRIANVVLIKGDWTVCNLLLNGSLSGI